MKELIKLVKLFRGAGPGKMLHIITVLKAVVTAWLNSPGHKSNIESNSNLTGVGVAFDGGTIYFTQIFIRSSINFQQLQVQISHQVHKFLFFLCHPSFADSNHRSCNFFTFNRSLVF